VSHKYVEKVRNCVARTAPRSEPGHKKRGLGNDGDRVPGSCLGENRKPAAGTAALRRASNCRREVEGSCRRFSAPENAQDIPRFFLRRNTSAGLPAAGRPQQARPCAEWSRARQPAARYKALAGD
jgi:hypothetical protein